MTLLAAPATEVATDVAATAPPAARRRVRWQRAVSPVAILVLWEALSRGGVLSPEKLPAPSTVLETGWRLTADGTLGAHLLDSL
ncbi:MAG TPA: ABC transporter permease, partial [Actinoplanes sp.]